MNSKQQLKIAIIGAGAAGFFAAINCKEHHPDAEVCILEKTKKYLTKVSISGGGRCNVCNAETSISALSKAYPRGGKKLKKPFKVFSTNETMNWFQKRGVKLYTQDDQRVFPTTDDSQTIIDCFLREVRKKHIHLRLSHDVVAINKTAKGFKLEFKKDEIRSELFDKVIIASGGSPKRSGLEWLEGMGHKIVDPVPSLFTFNMPKEPIKELMGVVAPNAKVKIVGSKLESDGPVLITHWGMSGPAILRLSAFGARMLYEKEYTFEVLLNWVNVKAQEEIKERLMQLSADFPNKMIQNKKPYPLPERLWRYLIDRIGIPNDKKWDELGKKGINKLVNILSHDVYHVRGKTTFKEEFVTCGGVSLESINMETMESRSMQGLYFCGEVLDIDGVTGGYNFQAAWTTAFIASKIQ